MITIDIHDPYEDNLPAGWFVWMNKPAIFKDLWETPNLIKSVYDLNSNQKWSLVIARMRKMPLFYLSLPFRGSFDQKSALAELEKKSSAGGEIRDDELYFLESLREARLSVLNETI